MTELEKRVLNEVQNGLPISKRPFREIAERLGIQESEVIDCLNSLKESGLIRRFGGILDVNRMGISSTLVCAKIDRENIEAVARSIGEYEGVTHNYERAGEYNLWFTLMESSEEKLSSILNKIEKEPGVAEMISLPAITKHKTKVFFKF